MRIDGRGIAITGHADRPTSGQAVGALLTRDGTGKHRRWDNTTVKEWDNLGVQMVETTSGIVVPLNLDRSKYNAWRVYIAATNNSWAFLTNKPSPAAYVDLAEVRHNSNNDAHREQKTIGNGWVGIQGMSDGQGKRSTVQVELASVPDGRVLGVFRVCSFFKTTTGNITITSAVTTFNIGSYQGQRGDVTAVRQGRRL